LNVTTTPDKAAPVALFKVAVSVAALVAEIAVVEPTSVKVGDAVVVVVVVLVLVLDPEPPPPPQAARAAVRVTMNRRTSARDQWVFNMGSCRWIANRADISVGGHEWRFD
jgi:hypothetical protein